jgi:hypothetical protein
LAGGALFLAITTVQGIIRDGFDPWQQAMSALSLGPGGWVQMINLIGLGVVMLSTVPTWRRILAGGTGHTAYPVLTAIVGASFVVVGMVRQDPAPGYDPAGLALTSPTPLGLVHLAVAGVAALASVASLAVMAVRFRGDPAWRRWSVWSWVAAFAVVGCVVVYGIWSVRSHGYAGTFERAAVAVPLVWMFALLRRLSAGTPFMLSEQTTLLRTSSGTRR